MSYMGSHQVIDPKHLRSLRQLPTDAERVSYYDTVIDKFYDSNCGTDYDKAWALIHSALQNSNPYADYLERSKYGPSSWAIMGNADIALTDECMITSASRWHVLITDRYLRGITAQQIAERLRKLIEIHGAVANSREDPEYAADWFPRLQDFYRHAAKRFWPIIFVGDLC